MNQITQEQEDKFVESIILSLHNQIEIQIWIMVNRGGWPRHSVMNYVNVVQAIYKWQFPNDVGSVGLLRYTLSELEELVSFLE